jgi:hypothetical protein
MRIVVLPDEGNGLPSWQPIDHGKAGQCGPRPSAAAAAGDLNAFRWGSFPGFSEDVPCVDPIAGQQEVRPPHPAGLPGSRWRRPAEQVHSESWPWPGRERSSQAAAPDEPAGWQLNHAGAGRVPGARHQAHLRQGMYRGGQLGIGEPGEHRSGHVSQDGQGRGAAGVLNLPPAHGRRTQPGGCPVGREFGHPYREAPACPAGAWEQRFHRVGQPGRDSGRPGHQQRRRPANRTRMTASWPTRSLSVRPARPGVGGSRSWTGHVWLAIRGQRGCT